MAKPTPRPWYLSLPAPLAASIADRYSMFAGWRLEEGGDGGGGDAGDGGGEGGKAGEGGDTGTQVDVTSLTADQLKEHPEFNGLVQGMIKDRLDRERAAWQKKLDDAQAKGTQTAEQQAEAARAQMQADLQAKDGTISDLRSALAAKTAESLASAAGAKPDRLAAVARLIDLTGAVDDDGQIVESVIKAAVAKVKKDVPELFGAGGGGGAGTSGGELGGEPAKPVFTKSQLDKMPQAEQLRRWDEIQKAMEDGRVDYAR